MSQSVDDMSQNKIVTNRPSTKKIVINHPYIFLHIAPFCDISSRTNATCDKSSVTYVTSNLRPNQWTICLKKGAIFLVLTNMNCHIYSDTGR